MKIGRLININHRTFRFRESGFISNLCHTSAAALDFAKGDWANYLPLCIRQTLNHPYFLAQVANDIKVALPATVVDSTGTMGFTVSKQICVYTFTNLGASDVYLHVWPCFHKRDVDTTGEEEGIAVNATLIAGSFDKTSADIMASGLNRSHLNSLFQVEHLNVVTSGAPSTRYARLNAGLEIMPGGTTALVHPPVTPHLAGPYFKQFFSIKKMKVIKIAPGACTTMKFQQRKPRYWRFKTVNPHADGFTDLYNAFKGSLDLFMIARGAVAHTADTGLAGEALMYCPVKVAFTMNHTIATDFSVFRPSVNDHVIRDNDYPLIPLAQQRIIAPDGPAAAQAPPFA